MSISPSTKIATPKFEMLTLKFRVHGGNLAVHLPSSGADTEVKGLRDTYLEP